MCTCTRKSHNQYQACIWNVWWYILMVKVLNEIYYIYVFPYFFSLRPSLFDFYFHRLSFSQSIGQRRVNNRIKRRILTICPLTFWWNINISWRFNFFQITIEIKKSETGQKKIINFLFLFLTCQEQGQEESVKLKGNNNGLRPQYIKTIFAEYCQPQAYFIF